MRDSYPYGQSREDDLPLKLDAVVFAIAKSEDEGIKENGYATAIMEAIRRLAASADKIASLELELRKYHDRESNTMMMGVDPNRPKILELPTNIRSVELKF